MAVADVETPSGDPTPRADASGVPADPVGQPQAAGRAGRLPYFPALDGLRGLAVAAVLFFHGGFAWMKGGYLGVSTFFTLSGFLITSLLLAERGQTGRVDLKAFWTRRFRRLMPAALACLAFVVVFGVFAADAIQRENLAGDVIAALAYVANWRFIFTNQSYADLFAAPSPVLHFWSLAIEEQFYLVYPVLIFGLLGLGRLAERTHDARRRYWLVEFGRRYRDVIGLALIALVLGSFALVRFGDLSKDHVYFGTLTRASELLVGAVLAVVLFHGTFTARLARRGVVRTLAVLIGVAALVAAVVLWTRTPQSADWLYAGGFTLYAVISALIISAAVLPVGPVRTVLAISPLRRLGVISYGVYLYHWPVFLWIRQKTDLAIWPRFLLGVAITLVMAELSFRFLETPIRHGHRLFRIRPIRLAPFAMAAIVAAVVAVTVTAPAPTFDFEGTQREMEALAAANDALPSTTVSPTATAAPAPRVAFFGDSTALMTSWGVGVNFGQTGHGMNALGWTGLGCGILRTPERRVAGDVEAVPESCNDWQTIYADALTKSKPDVAVVQVGPWDIADRQLPGDDTWRSPGDPQYDDFALSEMQSAVDTLSADGALVVWFTSPIPGKASVGDDQTGYDAPARMRRFNELIEQLPQLRPGKVKVVDLAGWLGTLGTAEDERLRPDGTHFTNATSEEAANRWVAQAILDAWQQDWTEKHADPVEGGTDPVTVVVVGDGTAQVLGTGLDDWSGDGGSLKVRTSAQSSCGIGRGGQRIGLTGQPEVIPDECAHWDTLYPVVLAGTPPDVVVASAGIWDVTDRDLGDGTWRALGDPYYDQYLTNEITQATDVLHSNGAKVVWMLSPHVDPGRQPDGTSPAFPASDPSRVDRLNEIIKQVVASRSDFATTVDYAGYAASWPGGEYDSERRPDGVIPTPKGADDIADWLAPQVLAIVAEQK